VRKTIAYCIALSMGLFLTSPLPADEPQSLLHQLKQAVGAAIQNASQPSEAADSDATPSKQAASVTWHATLEAAVDAARESGKPIFAIVGAPWCSFCEKLQGELKGKPETEIAEKWVLAKINADDQLNDARELNANALPALRLLSSDGIVTASRDGYAPVGELTQWLDDSYELTKAQMPSLLTKEIAELDESEIETLISLMAIRDVTARRVVLNRLAEMPQHAAGPAIDLFITGTLAHQLSALQLLKKWEAPVDGFDPWDPASMDDDALQQLQAWGSEKYPAKQVPANAQAKSSGQQATEQPSESAAKAEQD
jgi:thioredoxin-like negative regulator of GroEL